jgi:hypothetical protein
LIVRSANHRSRAPLDRDAQPRSTGLDRARRQHGEALTRSARATFSRARPWKRRALFLAGDESSYITGTDIVVSGGWFSSAPYLVTERSHHPFSLMDKKNTSKSSSTTSGSDQTAAPFSTGSATTGSLCNGRLGAAQREG